MSDAEDLQINWGPQPTTGDPEIHIYTDGDLRINAAAGREYFSDAKQTDVGVDADAGLLVFDPAGDRSPLKIRREGNEVGGEVAGASRTKQLLDLDRLDEPLHILLEERGDLLVADVQAALADDKSVMEFVSDDGYQSPPDDEPEAVSVADDVDIETADGILTEYHTSQPLVEEYLVDALARGEREVTSSEIADSMSEGVGARTIGHTLSALMKADDAPFAVDQTDETTDNGAMVWRVEPSVELAAKLEADDSVDLDAVLGEDVDSVQELAEALDIEEGEARRRAMDAGAYGDLQDNIKRPGVRD